jgi:sensor domain CHASE-containing protein
LRSIRTKFGVVTACILLGLLLVFYLGGRFILVHMIREAEKTIQVVGSDIKVIVYNEISNLQHAAAKVADEMSRAGGEVTHEFLQTQLGPFSGRTPINLVAALGPDGSFGKGCFLLPGEPIHPVEAADVQSYLASIRPLLLQTANIQLLSGVITFQEKPLFIALSPVKDGAESSRPSCSWARSYTTTP